MTSLGKWVYYCGPCRKWFHKGSLKCLMAHPEGHCCHYGEIELQPQTAEKLVEAHA